MWPGRLGNSASGRPYNPTPTNSVDLHMGCLRLRSRVFQACILSLLAGRGGCSSDEDTDSEYYTLLIELLQLVNTNETQLTV